MSWLSSLGSAVMPTSLFAVHRANDFGVTNRTMYILKIQGFYFVVLLFFRKMQHTEILELNACIAYLRTGKEAPQKGSAASRYDMTWTFTAPRDPIITELYVGSPDDSAWLPTAAWFC